MNLRIKENFKLGINPKKVLLVGVMVELVVASKSCKRTKTDGVGEEDLCSSINPHLKRE